MWPFGRPRSKWENNIKMAVKGMWYGRSLGRDSNNLTQGTLRSRQPIVWSSSSSGALSYCRSAVSSKVRPPDTVMRSNASSVSFRYFVVFLWPSRSCLLFLPRCPVTCIFPSIKGFRRQFLRKMWPIQLALLRFITVGGRVCVTNQYRFLNFVSI